MSMLSVSSSRSKANQLHGTSEPIVNSDKLEKVDDVGKSVLKRTSKRGREDSEEQDLDRLNIKVPRYSRLLKEIDRPIEMQMHEAFLLGYHQKRAQRITQIHEHGMQSLGDYAFIISESSKLGEPIKFNKTQQAMIDEIASTRSEIAADQFKELLLILNKSHHSHRPEGKWVIKFALQLIHTIPAIKNPIAKPKHGDQEALPDTEWMQSSASGLSFSKMCEKDKKTASEEAIEVDEAAKEILSNVTKSLGELLLILDQNHKTADTLKTAALIDEEDPLEANCERISTQATQLIEEAAECVLDRAKAHQNAAIQGCDETMLLGMSIEMAKLLVLSSGGINFGLAERVAALIVPKKLEETIAVQDILQTLTTVCNSQEVLTSIKRVNPPATKNINSDPAIRTLLEIPNGIPLTKRDAQIFVLSGLLSHIRQAFAGTCFATCFLIKAWNEQLDLVIEDLIECTEFGEVSRICSDHLRKFPFQTRITPEYLDTLITADKNGKILDTDRYIVRVNSLKDWPEVGENSMLYDAPSVKAVCLAMNIDEPRDAVLSALQNLPEQFSALQLIKELAKIAFENQERDAIALRSKPHWSQEKFVNRALYAFGSQTHHPLIRSYEQTTAIMVDYFAEPEAMSSWVYQTMDEALTKSAKGEPAAVQAMCKTLLKANFLPMISRMRYLYNHNFQDTRVLFQDGNHGIFENSSYGYELWDTGLPSDFVYDSTMYTQVKKEASWLHHYRFDHYPAKHTWRIVDSSERFQAFAKESLQETAKHLAKSLEPAKKERMAKAAALICQKIDSTKFITHMVNLIFGPGSQQKRKWDKNKYTIHTTPWKFRWGGDFAAVLKTFYGFKKKPCKMLTFKGSQHEVLAKCINYVKEQTPDIRDGYIKHYERIVITSPVHAFLLTPGEGTFQEAWNSELSATDYIQQHVLDPGLKVANKTLSTKTRNAMIEYVAGNQWYYRCNEPDDFERLQLTEASQGHFDDYLEDSRKQLLSLSGNEFEKEVCQLVFKSRADDINIRERNHCWENRYKTVFHKRMRELVSEEEMNKPLSRDVADELFDFARNHKDSIRLSDSGVEKFREAMSALPKKLSVQEFRKALVDAAYKIHCEDKGILNKDWKENFCLRVDTTLFSMLPKADQNRVIDAGIVTHDTNWKVSVYDCHLMFTVNPCSGELEICKYLPDLRNLSFMDQHEWFKNKHNGWDFPNNYRVYAEAPLFKKKHFWDK